VKVVLTGSRHLRFLHISTRSLGDEGGRRSGASELIVGIVFARPLALHLLHVAALLQCVGRARVEGLRRVLAGTGVLPGALGHLVFAFHLAEVGGGCFVLEGGEVAVVVPGAGGFVLWVLLSGFGEGVLGPAFLRTQFVVAGSGVL
jgi:hypothetical protein